MTLIALVITIIVMLILVSVTIATAVNGGLFEYAKKAVDETRNAINAEQQLANGKIKIGGKWYASLTDYINNNPIKSGIEINLAEITLKKKESEEVEAEEKLTETITAVGTEQTTVTLIAKCTYEGEEYTETREVTLEIIKKPVEVARGDFVYYDVAYTDVYYDTYEYTNTNGWRLLHYDTDENGNLYNVELISTGIPAKLYYFYGDTSTNIDWWVTTESSDDERTPNLIDFKNVLGGEENYVFYNGILEDYPSLQASAGMYYNFGDIKFAYGTSSRGENLGYFTSITVNDGTTYNVDNKTETTGKDLFEVGNNVETVRLLTLKEVNEALGRTDIDSKNSIPTTEDGTGLYRLSQLITVLGMNYNNTYYWLASPDPSETRNMDLCSISGHRYD